MSDFVHVDHDRRVMTITLDRPEVKNALSHEMYAAVADALTAAEASDQLRCVIITGRGDTFTSGNDLRDFATPMPEGGWPALRFLETLRDMDTPVIAAVNGAAVGVGLTMLLLCDMAFASERATFSAPFTRVGVVPEAGSSLLLPRAVGNAWANDILLTGRVLSASDALVAGLVSRVVADEELHAVAMAVAQQVADLAPNAMRASKRLIRGDRDRVAERMKRESEVFHAQLSSPEVAESLLAIREKRAPVFE